MYYKYMRKKRDRNLKKKWKDKFLNGKRKIRLTLIQFEGECCKV